MNGGRFAGATSGRDHIVRFVRASCGHNVAKGPETRICCRIPISGADLDGDRVSSRKSIVLVGAPLLRPEEDAAGDRSVRSCGVSWFSLARAASFEPKRGCKDEGATESEVAFSCRPRVAHPRQFRTHSRAWAGAPAPASGGSSTRRSSKCRSPRRRCSASELDNWRRTPVAAHVEEIMHNPS